MDSDIFDGLSKLNLSNYEIRIYKALLLKGPMNSTNIVKETSIPQPRVYDLFSSLQNKGFIESSAGRKKLYKAIPISTVMERERRWLDSYSFDLERYVQNKKIYNNTKDSFISIIEGDDHITEKFYSLIEQTEDELILSINYDRYKLLYPAIEKLTLKNVTLVIILFLDRPQRMNEQFEGNCFVRTMTGKPIEMIISDRTSCVIKMETKERKNDVALYFEEDNFIHVVSNYFNQSLWKYGTIYIDKMNEKCIRLRTIWLACDLIEYLLANDYKINAHLEGYHIDDYRNLDGEITKVDKIPFVRDTFFIRSKGKEYSVGGKTSNIEELRMIFLKITPEILQKRVLSFNKA